jgi:histidinol-phosphatase (PHP family)
LAVKSGIKIFTVGSDAHSLEDLGGYINEALEILKEYKLRNHVFNRRQATSL